MSLTYFVLTLYCLTCQPLEVYSIHGIDAYGGGSSQWAGLGCQELGDILSGDWERRNMKLGTPIGKYSAKQYFIVYTCEQESGNI